MISADVYQDQAKGILTEDDVSEVEQFSAMLKSAGVPPPIPTPIEAAPPAAFHGGEAQQQGNNAQTAMMTGLLQGVGAAGAGLIGHGATKGIRAAGEKLTRGRDLKKALDVYPHLNDQYSPEDVKLVWNSLRHLNPWLTKDPLTAGTLLGQTLRNRDVQNPSAAPRMDLGIAKELVRTEPARQDPMSQAVVGGLQTGVSEGVRTYGNLQAGKAQAQQRVEDHFNRQSISDRDLDLRGQQQMEMEGFKDRLGAYGDRATQGQKDQMAMEAEKSRLKRQGVETGLDDPMSRSDTDSVLLQAALRGDAPLVEPTANAGGEVTGQRRAWPPPPRVQMPPPGGRGTS